MDGATQIDVDNVRLLIGDLATDPIFSDTQLEQFLALESSVKRAAAQALDVMASSEAMVSKKIRTLDLQTDGPAVATSLREQSASLREQDLFDQGGEVQMTHSQYPPELGEWPYIDLETQSLWPYR